MAFFCTKTGQRLIAPGTVDTALAHDGSDAANEAEHAASAHIREHFERTAIGTSEHRPPPDDALAASAAAVAALVLQSKEGAAEAKDAGQAPRSPEKKPVAKAEPAKAPPRSDALADK